MKQDDKNASQDAGNFFSGVFVKTILMTLAYVSLPPMILLGAGMVADDHFGTKPVLVIVGSVVGLALAAGLVAQQIKHVKKGAL
jgi:F0F1-type ATP synthase assembly protein I